MSEEKYMDTAYSDYLELCQVRGLTPRRKNSFTNSKAVRQEISATKRRITPITSMGWPEKAIGMRYDEFRKKKPIFSRAEEMFKIISAISMQSKATSANELTKVDKLVSSIRQELEETGYDPDATEKVTLVSVSDDRWEGVYVDGQLEYEGHEVDMSEYRDVMHIEVHDPNSILGNLPQKLDNLEDSGWKIVE